MNYDKLYDKLWVGIYAKLESQILEDHDLPMDRTFDTWEDFEVNVTIRYTDASSIDERIVYINFQLPGFYLNDSHQFRYHVFSRDLSCASLVILVDDTIHICSDFTLELWDFLLQRVVVGLEPWIGQHLSFCTCCTEHWWASLSQTVEIKLGSLISISSPPTSHSATIK